MIITWKKKLYHKKLQSDIFVVEPEFIAVICVSLQCRTPANVISNGFSIV